MGHPFSSVAVAGGALCAIFLPNGIRRPERLGLWSKNSSRYLPTLRLWTRSLRRPVPPSSSPEDQRDVGDMGREEGDFTLTFIYSGIPE